MPKLPALTPQKIMKIIQKRGFLLDRIKGSHHIFFNPETKRRVIIPFHKQELPIGTLIEILKQAGIDRDEIEDLS